MTTHPEYLALLATVCERPEDDAPRLIIADWLEENGEDERANEIRYYVAHPSLTVASPLGLESDIRIQHRGFIHEIRLTCREFMGGKCGNCNDRGEVYVFAGPESHWDKCDKCHGNKTVPGVARELFERHPITRVVLTDKKPEHTMQHSSAWFIGRLGLANDPPDRIDRLLFDLLPPQEGLEMSRHYDTESVAIDTLSIACVRYGRSLANLPPLF